MMISQVVSVWTLAPSPSTDTTLPYSQNTFLGMLSDRNSVYCTHVEETSLLEESLSVERLDRSRFQ